jgi:hypothetical protein
MSSTGITRGSLVILETDERKHLDEGLQQRTRAAVIFILLHIDDFAATDQYKLRNRKTVVVR